MKNSTIDDIITDFSALNLFLTTIYGITIRDALGDDKVNNFIKCYAFYVYRNYILLLLIYILCSLTFIFCTLILYFKIWMLI